MNRIESVPKVDERTRSPVGSAAGFVNAVFSLATSRASRSRVRWLLGCRFSRRRLQREEKSDLMDSRRGSVLRVPLEREEEEE